jgi:hypothetical protein
MSARADASFYSRQSPDGTNADVEMRPLKCALLFLFGRSQCLSSSGGGRAADAKVQIVETCSSSRDSNKLCTRLIGSSVENPPSFGCGPPHVGDRSAALQISVSLLAPPGGRRGAILRGVGCRSTRPKSSMQDDRQLCRRALTVCLTICIWTTNAWPAFVEPCIPTVN